MLDKLKKIGAKAKDAATSATTFVSDLNGDGKVDAEDMRIAAEWAKKKAVAMGEEATRIGKDALRSDLAKDAAAGAAVGAIVAVPVPVVGPLAGAVLGAGVGVYKNITKKGNTTPHDDCAKAGDVYADLLKLNELRQKKVISDIEFEAEKMRLLNSR